MGTDFTARLPTEKYSSRKGKDIDQFPTFPLLSSPSGFQIPTSFPLISVPQDRNKTKSVTTAKVGRKIKDELDDEGYGELSVDPIPPSVKPKATNGKQKRAMAASAAKNTDPKKRVRASNPTNTADTDQTTSKNAAKKQPPPRIKRELNEGEDEGSQQGKKCMKRDHEASTGWTQEELDLVHELYKENKTSKQIFLELQNRFGSTRTQNSVNIRCHLIKKTKIEWSSEDVYIYCQFLLKFRHYS